MITKKRFEELNEKAKRVPLNDRESKAWDNFIDVKHLVPCGKCTGTGELVQEGALPSDCDKCNGSGMMVEPYEKKPAQTFKQGHKYYFDIDYFLDSMNYKPGDGFYEFYTGKTGWPRSCEKKLLTVISWDKATVVTEWGVMSILPCWTYEVWLKNS
jgi:hypothetical protein